MKPQPGPPVSGHQWTSPEGCVQEHIPEVLATCSNHHTELKRGLPSKKCQLGTSWRRDKPRGTSCHWNKLLLWVQLRWQPQCQAATEGNIVLFFRWAWSFQVSKQIPWGLLNRAGLRQTVKSGKLPFHTVIPQCNQEYRTPPPPSLSRTPWVCFRCWRLSFPSPIGTHLSWNQRHCFSLMTYLMPKSYQVKMPHLPNYSHALCLQRHNGDTMAV